MHLYNLATLKRLQILKQSEICRVGTTAHFFHRTAIKNVSDVLGKMLNLCFGDVSHRSNANSVVVAELAICCHLSPRAQSAESEVRCALRGETYIY